MLSTLLTLTQLSSAASGSLCQPPEKTYFECTTKKGTIISVCGSKSFSPTEGYLQYRYGTEKKIDLEFPGDRNDSAKKFFYVLYTRPQTSYQNLSFTNAGTKYSVFSHYDGDSSPPVSSAGVLVVPKGSPKGITVACAGKPVNELSALKEFASCDPDDALSGGSCEAKSILPKAEAGKREFCGKRAGTAGNSYLLDEKGQEVITLSTQGESSLLLDQTDELLQKNSPKKQGSQNGQRYCLYVSVDAEGNPTKVLSAWSIH